MESLEAAIIFGVVHCGKCGISFCLTKAFIDQRRADHNTFYCPNGDGRAFNQKSDLDLERERAAAAVLAQQQARTAELLAQAEANKARHARIVAERKLAKVEKEKNAMEQRIKGGVCPCCNRTFADLAAHMGTKHKGFSLPPGKPKMIEKATV